MVIKVLCKVCGAKYYTNDHKGKGQRRYKIYKTKKATVGGCPKCDKEFLAEMVKYETVDAISYRHD